MTTRQRSCRKVMSSDCVSVILLFVGGPHATITHDVLDLTVHGPLPWSLFPDIRPGTPSSPPDIKIGAPKPRSWSPCYWHLMAISLGTCSNLKTCSLENLAHQQHLVVATEAHAVCKPAVRILLECRERCCSFLQYFTPFKKTSMDLFFWLFISGFLFFVNLFFFFLFGFLFLEWSKRHLQFYINCSN